MKILVNGVQVYSDVEGAGVRANDPAMQEMPTLNLLHRRRARITRISNRLHHLARSPN